MHDEYSKEEKSQGTKILSFIIGVAFCAFGFFNSPSTLNISDFKMIEGTADKNVIFKSNSKGRKHFLFTLKEDVYHKATFISRGITYDVDRNLVKQSLKAGSKVSFNILKEDFEKNFAVQHDDYDGPKKLNDCSIRIRSLRINNTCFLNLDTYIASTNKQTIVTGIVTPIIGVCLILFSILNLEKRFPKHPSLIIIAIMLTISGLGIYCINNSFQEAVPCESAQ